MIDLIEGLEQRRFPRGRVHTRLLADEVLLAVGWRKAEIAESWTSPDGRRQLGPSTLPNPLTSVDDALELVPEGWTWDVDATAPECGIDWRLHEPGINGVTVKGTSEVAAVALTIAALKARVSMMRRRSG